MNNELLIDINQFPGAAMYAKLHNISFKQLVENLLMKFQTFSTESEVMTADTDDFLDAIDENLMKRTFETIHQDYLEGKCKPHEQVMSEIMEKRGWK